MYSLALSKGWRAGSRLRGVRATSLPGACADDAERVSALIFCDGRQYPVDLSPRRPIRTMARNSPCPDWLGFLRSPSQKVVGNPATRVRPALSGADKVCDAGSSAGRVDDVAVRVDEGGLVIDVWEG